MTLPLPNLDNRQWIDLVDEGRALIPRYDPDWTDHNVSDPGITLMELFAWLSEMTVYRLNRIPESHLRKFLALLDFYPFPPLAAQTVLSFMPDAGMGPFILPTGVEFEAMDPGGPRVLFRTLRDLTVAFFQLNVLQLEQLNLSEQPSERVFLDLTRDWRDGLPIELLGHNSQTEPVLYFGFDTLPTEIPIALAFHFQVSGSDSMEYARLIREADAQHLACRPIRADIVCEETPLLLLLPTAELLPHHSVQLVWEILTSIVPEQWTVLESVVGRAQPGVGEVLDDTRALTLNGIVEFNLPDSLARGALGQVTESLFYLRCRLVAGSYDTPPLLTEIMTNGVFAEQAVPVSQRFEIAADAIVNGPEPDFGLPIHLDFTLDNDGVIQALTFLAPDAVPDHPDLHILDYSEPGDPTLETPGYLVIQAVLAGFGNGRPEQHLNLPQAQVQVDSLNFYTHSEGAWQRWSQHNDFDTSSRTDFDFVLDATTGEVTFGNGERGRVIPVGVPVLALYRTTHGNEGNVTAGSVTRPADTPFNDVLLSEISETERDALSTITINRLSATDGADVEPLVQTIGRAVETLHAHQHLLDLCAETSCASLDDVTINHVRSLHAPTRAVNLLDIERLALDVPGTRVARVRAWPASHPSYPCLQAEGVITVVVMPDLPIPKPEPSEGLLKAVKRYLDRRRMVTTRLEVVGPQYLEVRVKARVRARPFADLAGVRERILAALNTFLDPRIGGPEGMGWPFGRNVYRSEILQLIDEVVNVDHVLELTLQTDNGEPQCGNVLVCPTWLVTHGEHRIEVIRGET